MSEVIQQGSYRSLGEIRSVTNSTRQFLIGNCLASDKTALSPVQVVEYQQSVPEDNRLITIRQGDFYVRMTDLIGFTQVFEDNRFPAACQLKLGTALLASMF